MTAYAIPANLKAASKAEALDTVRELLTTDPENRKLLSLLLYFTPKAPKTPKRPEQWVAQFVAIKDLRSYLNYLYSDGKRLLGCDGHRLAWMPTTWPAGYYCPKTFAPVSGMDGIKYPDVDRVIPAMTHPEGVEVQAADLSRTTDVKFTRCLVNSVPFSDAYVTCALSGSDVLLLTTLPERREVAGRPAEHTVMRGRSAHGEFVVMPLRD